MFVCDEVMSGFYRTGSKFAFMRFDVKPDIITFAKGSTCGYIPLGGVIVKREIAEYFNDRKMFNGLTYSAHPMGCAAAVATMDEYERLGIEENVKKQGRLLADSLDALEQKHKSVGEVRYIGLFAMIEFVKDKESREPRTPFNGDPEGRMAKLGGMLKAEGFVTYSHENMIIVAPPLIITEKELREAMRILDKVLDAADAMI
jgi:taurine--2-oxoglutarate transaminase